MQDSAQQILASKYFLRENMGEIFILLTANEEMSIDKAQKYVCRFKTPQLRKEFMEAVDLSCYQSFPQIQEANRGAEEEIPQNRSLLQQIKESLHMAMERVSQQECRLINTGITKETRNEIKQFKLKWIAKSKKTTKYQSIKKVEYLKGLIKSIIQKFNKESDEEVIEEIIRYGGIDPVITHNLFASDISFRSRFKNILENCKTFKKFKLYRGEDIQLMRDKLADALIESLIQLGINEKAAESILNQLLKRPLSNIVANRTDITDQQKISFYRSEFYRSGITYRYAQILNYERSLEFRFKEEIGKILEFIEDNARITRETLDCILSLKFFDFLYSSH